MRSQFEMMKSKRELTDKDESINNSMELLEKAILETSSDIASIPLSWQHLQVSIIKYLRFRKNTPNDPSVKEWYEKTCQYLETVKKDFSAHESVGKAIAVLENLLTTPRTITPTLS